MTDQLHHPDNRPPRRTAILISGRGSNMTALIDAASQPGYPASISVVISNRPEAPGLDRARAAGLATAVIDHTGFADRAAFDEALDATLRSYNIELICLAGFMRLLTADFTNRWHDRILNIHPSLLPAFKGLNVHRRVVDAGVRITGCTVHLVTAEMDDGPIIAQAAVPVLPGDTPDQVAGRVLCAEHRCYPYALSVYARGSLIVESGRLVTKDGNHWQEPDAHHSCNSSNVLLSPAPHPPES